MHNHITVPKSIRCVECGLCGRIFLCIRHNHVIYSTRAAYVTGLTVVIDSWTDLRALSAAVVNRVLIQRQELDDQVQQSQSKVLLIDLVHFAKATSPLVLLIIGNTLTYFRLYTISSVVGIRLIQKSRLQQLVFLSNINSFLFSIFFVVFVLFYIIHIPQIYLLIYLMIMIIFHYIRQIDIYANLIV